MFEITAEHIKRLDDCQLRKLIGLLCEREFQNMGLPRKGVSWGGDQNAPDGGIDVKCEKWGREDQNLFLPRNHVGFQVKTYDLSPSQIANEMMPHGKLRESIRELHDKKGAYILVCGNATLSDSMYRKRRSAMEAIIKSQLPESEILLDFYDSDTIVCWVRAYPSVTLWMREAIGEPLTGWRSYEKWSDFQQKRCPSFFVDREKRFCDITSQKEMTVLEGIELIRRNMRQGGMALRLTGLSGVGKTRLLEALFHPEIGSKSLEPEQVIYGDLSEELDPAPEQMLRYLFEEEGMHYLILDNCGLDRHNRLMKMIQEKRQKNVSILTVEYDVKEQDTEETKCFRLNPASDNVIRQLLSHNFDSLSSGELDRLTRISGGNARLALAFAKTLQSRPSISMLTDQELFTRLFWQKGQEEYGLLQTAEVLSLLYSIDFQEIGEEGELEKISRICGHSVLLLLRHIRELEKRGLLQKRGRWCAVLPHALSNYLAMEAIQTYGTYATETLLRNGTVRMRYSFAHRLSLLTGEKCIQDLAGQWLRERYGDGAGWEEEQEETFVFLSRIEPHTAIECIRSNWNRLNVSGLTVHLICRVMKELTFRPEVFSEGIQLLLLMELEGMERKEKIPTGIEECFHYYDWMDHGACEARKGILTEWISSEDPQIRKIGSRCLFATMVQGSKRKSEFLTEIPKTTGEDFRHWFQTFLPWTAEQFVKEYPVFSVGAPIDMYASRLSNLLGRGIDTLILHVVQRIRARRFWKSGYLWFSGIKKFEKEKLGEEFQAILDCLRPSTQEEQLLFWGTLDSYERKDMEISRETYEKQIEVSGRFLVDHPELLTGNGKEIVLTVADNGKLGEIVAASPNRKKIWECSCDVLHTVPYQNKLLFFMKGIIRAIPDDKERSAYLSKLLTHPVLYPAYFSMVFSAGCFREEKERIRRMMQNGDLERKDLELLRMEEAVSRLTLLEWMDFFEGMEEDQKWGAFLLDICSRRIEYEKKTGKGCSKGDMQKLFQSVIDHKLPLAQMDQEGYEVFCEAFPYFHGEKILEDLYVWFRENLEQSWNLEESLYQDRTYYEFLRKLAQKEPILFLDVFVKDLCPSSKILPLLEEAKPLNRSVLWEIDPEVLHAWCKEKPDQRYAWVFLCRYGYQKEDGTYEWTGLVKAAIQEVEDQKKLAVQLTSQIRPMYVQGPMWEEIARRMRLYDWILRRLEWRDASKEVSEIVQKEKEKAEQALVWWKEKEKNMEESMQRFE